MALPNIWLEEQRLIQARGNTQPPDSHLSFTLVSWLHLNCGTQNKNYQYTIAYYMLINILIAILPWVVPGYMQVENVSLISLH